METTPAILLRKARLSDTSLIVTWITPDHGKVRSVAKGALRPKSKFAGVLDLFCHCEIAFVRNRKGDLHALHEAILLNPREPIRRDHLKVALACYLVELLELVTETDHPTPDLFDLFERALTYVENVGADVRALTHFENELVRLLGIANPSVSSAMTIGRTYHRVPASRAELLLILPHSSKATE